MVANRAASPSSGVALSTSSRLYPETVSGAAASTMSSDQNTARRFCFHCRSFSTAPARDILSASRKPSTSFAHGIHQTASESTWNPLYPRIAPPSPAMYPMLPLSRLEHASERRFWTVSGNSNSHCAQRILAVSAVACSSSFPSTSTRSYLTDSKLYGCEHSQFPHFQPNEDLFVFCHSSSNSLPMVPPCETKNTFRFHRS